MRIQVWDAAIRLTHWLMVVLVAVSWWTAESGLLNYHRFSGYMLLGLLAFRIYWGFAGSWTARFSGLLTAPRAIRTYARRVLSRTTALPATAGHNPLGGLSVLALLMLLACQVTLGLFAVDIDGIESGPLSHLVSFETGRACAEWHEDLFNVLLGVIVLHIGAVLFYLIYRRDNLIASMIHGKREFTSQAVPQPATISVPRLLIGIALASLIVWSIVRGG